MTRGGVRKGAGRPKAKREKRTANLCGVRVTPTQLANYKQAAGLSDFTLSEWVTFHLDCIAESHINWDTAAQERKRREDKLHAFMEAKYKGKKS